MPFTFFGIKNEEFRIRITNERKKKFVPLLFVRLDGHRFFQMLQKYHKDQQFRLDSFNRVETTCTFKIKKLIFEMNIYHSGPFSGPEFYEVKKIADRVFCSDCHLIILLGFRTL